MFREFNLVNSFTIEVSFMGANRGHLKGMHFSQQHMIMAGRQFCLTLADYSRDQERAEKCLDSLNKLYPQGGTEGKEPLPAML